jgi:hypothetical protein
MNREQAIQTLTEYGLTAKEAEALVTTAESDNCESTSRLRNDNDTTIEYRGSAVAANGYTGVSVFYYPDESEFLDAFGNPIEDLSNINWEIDHYTTW